MVRWITEEENVDLVIKEVNSQYIYIQSKLGKNCHLTQCIRDLAKELEQTHYPGLINVIRELLKEFVELIDAVPDQFPFFPVMLLEEMVLTQPAIIFGYPVFIQ